MAKLSDVWSRCEKTLIDKKALKKREKSDKLIRLIDCVWHDWLQFQQLKLYRFQQSPFSFGTQIDCKIIIVIIPSANRALICLHYARRCSQRKKRVEPKPSHCFVYLIVTIKVKVTKAMEKAVFPTTLPPVDFHFRAQWKIRCTRAREHCIKLYDH